MSTLTATAEAMPGAATRRSRPIPPPIPFHRIVGVELRKGFDTRAGFWLLAGVVVVAVLATAAVMLWAPDEALTYNIFGAAVGTPMAILLPMVAILSVTSEWSQRTGLTTFTLVPRRGRTIAAKAVVALFIGVSSILIALGVAAFGALVGPMLRGIDPTFDLSLDQAGSLVLSQVLGMGVGFMLGVVLRSSAAAIVAYFVYWGLLPTLSGLLSSTQEWYRDVMPWVDFSYNQTQMYERVPVGTEWAHLGVTSLVWLVIPLTIGLWSLLRSEIK